MIAFVWAEDSRGLIGKQNVLPWHLPNDLKFFKQVTTGHTIVMGRKTFDGMGKRLLPKRQTIVMTQDKHYDGNGAIICDNIQEIVTLAKNTDVYVIGGSQIFDLFMPYVDKLYQTKIHHTFDGDAYMAKIDYTRFKKVYEEQGELDDKNKYAHTFYIFERLT
ncbi:MULTISPECIES: dihydrofolate reductase [unclassified Granulicatella]|uniref:dihydrofolate reductase n=1 Tax=unclassified Granulicatella TaxID=2630493 RepID=UPI0010747F0B|nr:MULTISPECIES: dihydrofolate reductase [unclassified Granulicatella]MBF0779841.1 dihydrofolate reductase [Granulicatella sp. 19428wC4_WM01]TFU96141.1 dihydrofolate reductase [Granulicatella sp. WM01]